MEYSNQFRQPAFRGFGDQAMRHHRVTPPQTPAPDSAPQATSSTWSQPELPTPSTTASAPAAPAGPARLTPAAQARAQIGAARTQARDARVATAQANAAAAQHRLTAAQARTTAAQRRAQSAQRASAPPPSGPTQGPQTRMNWLRSQPPTAHTTPQAPASSPQPQSVTINRNAYNAAGLRFNAPPPPLTGRPAPAQPSAPAPPRPTAPPAGAAPAQPQAPAWAGRAARYGGLAVGLGAKAFESVNKVATDPKKSGNPLYKTSGGWSKA